MRWRILVSLLSLAIICFGVGYAVGRERLRDPDHLHALYQETNKQFFGGQLPDVELKAHDLSDQNAEGITYQETENRFVIVLDPKWNTSEEEALHAMRGGTKPVMSLPGREAVSLESVSSESLRIGERKKIGWQESAINRCGRDDDFIALLSKSIPPRLENCRPRSCQGLRLD
jgi:hypothetical protein